MKKFNVIDFGAKADGKTLCSTAVQQAIDACCQAGGGQVFFPQGEYVLSTVFLKDNVEIYIPEGTKVLGSLNFDDYAPHEEIDYPAYQDASHTYFNTSMFVAVDCVNVSLKGNGVIDMRSVWDEENIRKMVHRGAKTVAFKNCKEVVISDLTILNTTDLAIYVAGCENVDIFGIKMRVYIDGISPDNCKNVRIHDCDVETGDDGIVFKSSYTLNKLDVCKDVHVYNCRVKSRCNAVKFGTETNGGFENFLIENIDIRETRITGLAIESVDGAVIDGITIRNIKMKNVQSILFIHVGKRMRGPEGRKVGSIKNVLIENVDADGPYVPYEVIEWNYQTFVAHDTIQAPWGYGGPKRFEKVGGAGPLVNWQMTSNVCGRAESPLENITLRNFNLKLDGGVQEYQKEVPEEVLCYPEIHVYGYILPAKGIYFRHIDGLTLDNVKVETYRADARETFVFEKVNGLIDNR